MSKDIKEFIKYYLGQDVVYDGEKYSLQGLNEYSLRYGHKGAFVFKDADDCHWVNASEIKLVLRKLESITEEEMKERFFGSRDHYESWLIANDRKWHIDDLHWFLKNGFDMFELIREGLAVDKETLVRPEIKPGE